jgi:RNA polymerase sigma factor (sigma-70 family)
VKRKLQGIRRKTEQAKKMAAAKSSDQEQAVSVTCRWPRALTKRERSLLKKLLAKPIDYMEDDAFEAEDARSNIFAEEKIVDRPRTGWYSRLAHERKLTRKTRTTSLPLLTPKQEIEVFLQFNYARCRAEMARQEIQPPRLTLAQARELLHWHQKSLELREIIAEYNLALVLAMAKRLPSTNIDFPEMISEGNMALLRSIDKFNVSKGFKFSTYACRAILKAFSRLGTKTTRHRAVFPVGFEPDLERSNYQSEKAADEEMGCVEQVSRIFKENRCNLSDLELEVITKRFAFDKPDAPKGMTLQALGREIGLTKERVRQIQIHALAKMRDNLENTYLNGPSVSEARLRKEIEAEQAEREAQQ